MFEPRTLQHLQTHILKHTAAQKPFDIELEKNLIYETDRVNFPILEAAKLWFRSISIKIIPTCFNKQRRVVIHTLKGIDTILSRRNLNLETLSSKIIFWLHFLT